MAIGNTFKLAKLTIEAFTDVARQHPLAVGALGSNALVVLYNPETLSTRHESAYQGKRKGIAVWTHNRSRELSVKLLFDGTHVGQFGAEQLTHQASVAEQVKTFLAMGITVVAETHEPAYLRLKWGDGIFGLGGFECRLQSVEIDYTAFERDGSPLRAELTAKFIEAVDPGKRAAEERLSSPDLTHRRTVRAGDTLPLLCREVYGSAEHYLRVARINELDDFGELVPGQELIFPPFARRERG